MSRLNEISHNHLQSHSQKLKDFTSRSSSLSDILLLYIPNTFAEESTAESGGHNDTPTAVEIWSACTGCLAELVLEQLDVSCIYSI